MVKPYFQNLDIDCWLHPSKSQPSICVFHSPAQPCTAILRAFEELEADEAPANRTLTFRPGQRRKSLSTLRLKLVAESEQLKVMNISCAGAVATIEMTPRGLHVLRDAVLAWGGGAEDFGVSFENAGLKKKQLGSRDLASMELWSWGPGYEP